LKRFRRHERIRPVDPDVFIDHGEAEVIRRAMRF
jgi:hypothetical protein